MKSRKLQQQKLELPSPLLALPLRQKMITIPIPSNRKRRGTRKVKSPKKCSIPLEQGIGLRPPEMQHASNNRKSPKLRPPSASQPEPQVQQPSLEARPRVNSPPVLHPLHLLLKSMATGATRLGALVDNLVSPSLQLPIPKSSRCLGRLTLAVGTRSFAFRSHRGQRRVHDRL